MSDVDPDLGLRLIEQGRASKSILFTRVPLLQIARLGAEQFSQVQNLELERAYCASFDFDRIRMGELLQLLPAELAKHMAEALAAPFSEPHVLDLSEHALAIDIRARVGPVHSNEHERFAPFVVEAFLPWSVSWGLVFNEVEGAPPEPVTDAPHASPEPPAIPEGPKLGRKRRAPKPFLECERDEQENTIWQSLVLRGPLPKDDAVREAAKVLRDNGAAAFHRLDAAGDLYGAILAAIERNVKDGSMDRPQRGYVRACVQEVEQLERDDWQKLLIGALENGAMTREEVVRGVAEYARLVVGLPFERLREDGKIAVAIRSAINGALRKSLIVDQRGLLTVATDDDTDGTDAGDDGNALEVPVARAEATYVADRPGVRTPVAATTQPLMAFSWGYYGWGNHTRELIDLVDRVEASRGFAPPMFIDVRLRRQVRALGFRERAFEQLLGPSRHAWIPGLGNRMIGDSTVEEPTLDDPAAIDDLLAAITRGAEENRRVIFFCSCKSPRERHSCHRGMVVDLLVKTARKHKVPLAVQEWPGGEPVVASLEVSSEQMAKLLPLAQSEVIEEGRLPLPEGVSLAMAAALPHCSALRCVSGKDEVMALAGPIFYTVRGWTFPLYSVHALREMGSGLLESFGESFDEARLQVFGAKVAGGTRWERVDLARESIK